MPTLTPVDYDPFAQPNLVPVDYDPFAEETTTGEFAGGLGLDLLQGIMRAPKVVPDLLQMFGGDTSIGDAGRAGSDFFQRGIDAAQDFKPDAYVAEQQLPILQRDENGSIVGINAPSAESVAGTVVSSLPQIPQMLVGGGLATSALKALGLARGAGALGFGLSNAANVAPAQYDDTYREAVGEVGEGKAREQALESSELTALLSAVTGTAGAGLAGKLGGEAKTLIGALAKGFIADAPFEGAEEAGQSIIDQSARDKPIDLAAAGDAGLLGLFAGGMPGAAIGGLEHAGRARVTGPQAVPEAPIEPVLADIPGRTGTAIDTSAQVDMQTGLPIDIDSLLAVLDGQEPPEAPSGQPPPPQAAPTLPEIIEAIRRTPNDNLAEAPATDQGNPAGVVPVVAPPADAPQPLARTAPARKPFYEMTPDEISAQAEYSRTGVKEIENRILGPRADEYRRAVRQADSSDPKRADAGYEKQSAIEDLLTESEKNELFGMGEDPAKFDDVADYVDALDATHVGSEQEAAERLGYYLSQMGRTKGQDPSGWSRGEQVAYSAIRNIRDRIAESGWDSAAIQRNAIQRAAGRFADPNDAAFMLERFMPKAAPRANTDASETPSLQVAELTETDLKEPERIAFARHLGEGEASRRSIAEGEADAENKGIRAAVQAVVGSHEVTYLHGYEGLPTRLRDGVARRDRTGRQGRTSGLYDPTTGKVYVFTDRVTSPAHAAFIAAHEVAGHHGLRSLLGGNLDKALGLARQNPTVEALARAITKQRKMKPKEQLRAVEEALAELAGAVRTGDYAHIERRYGLEIPEGIRASVKAAIENFIRRLKTLLAKQGVQFTDEDVRSLLESAWKAAKGEGRSMGERGDALESVEATDTTAIPPSGPRLAAGDVRRADHREASDPGVIERAKQDVVDQIEGLRKFAKGRPKNPRNIKQRLNSVRSSLFDSVVSRARSLEKRNPDAKSLRKLFSQVLTAPGESRLVAETMNEDTERRFAQFTNRVRNILSNNGMGRVTDAQNDQLRETLLGTRTDASAPIKQAAKAIRKLIDVAREDLIAAGVEVGEVEDIGYLTRLYDDAVILSDEAGFLSAASDLYANHEFALEVGSNTKATMADGGNLARFLAYARRAATSDASVADALTKVKAALKARDVASIEPLIDSIRRKVADNYGEVSASAWLHKIKTPTVGEVFNGVGPSGSPVTKKRVLSGAADTVMAQYLNTNLLDILDTYARTTAKKIAMAERFGPKGEKVQKLIDSASQEGVPKHDLDEAVELMESALGNYSPINPNLKSSLDGLQAWTYLGLLSRVTFSSAAEAMTFAIRTGNLTHALAPLVQAYRGALKTQHGKDLKDMALLIGLNGNQAMEEVMQNQLGGDYGMEPKWSKLIHRFMSATLLTQLTRAQRAYGVGAATGYLRWIAKNVARGKRVDEMAVYLNELGVADHEAFADWMLAQGALPDPMELHDADGRATPRGQDYMTAVRRIVDQTIQNPNAAHRPKWMNSPFGRVAGSIMGFSYAAYENIIKREVALSKTLRREAGTGAQSRRMAAALSGMAALALGQTLVSTVRELLFNAARFEDKDDEEIAKEMAMLGLSRTFGLGSGDPMIQFLTGLKYQKGVGETMLGASLGTLAERVDAVASPFTDRNSPNTDTAEYRALEAVYSGVITPVANAILSRIPFLSAPAILAVSDRRMRDWFAGSFFTQPERETDLDRSYRAAVRELADVESAVKERMAMLPTDQWAEELAALKAEYPTALAGVTLDIYIRGGKWGGPGDPKMTDEGKPVLKLAGTKKGDPGTALGELEGYRVWDNYNKEYATTEGIQDRIKTLNRAINNLRKDDDVTIGDLMSFATQAPTVATLTGRDESKRAGSTLVNQVLDELMELRRAEKRQAIDVLDMAKRGEPIPRTSAAH